MKKICNTKTFNCLISWIYVDEGLRADYNVLRKNISKMFRYQILPCCFLIIDRASLIIVQSAIFSFTNSQQILFDLSRLTSRR